MTSPPAFWRAILDDEKGIQDGGAGQLAGGKTEPLSWQEVGRQSQSLGATQSPAAKKLSATLFKYLG